MARQVGQAGSVGEDHGHTAEGDQGTHRVPRGAGDGGDDHPVLARQGVEEGGLAGVDWSDDCDAWGLPERAAEALGGQELAERGREVGRAVPGQGAHGLLQRAVELIEEDLGAKLGARAQQGVGGLGLDEAASAEGKKRLGVNRFGAAPHEAVQDALDGHQPAVAVDLQAPMVWRRRPFDLARDGFRLWLGGGHEAHEHLVHHLAGVHDVAIVEPAGGWLGIEGLAASGLEELAGELERPRPDDVEDGDPALARRGEDRRDGAGGVNRQSAISNRQSHRGLRR